VEDEQPGDRDHPGGGRGEDGATDVGFSQLLIGSPCPVPGTRPEATAPATAPKQYGVMTDDDAKATPLRRCSAVRMDTFRKANPEPRNTMPKAAIPIGTYSVVMIAANAVGKPDQSTTRQKISQVWLASQTGPSAWSIRARGRAPRAAPPAVRSHSPVPKSAPPKTP
jgi:hypothetical protein